jgi:hypothetical protein
MTGSIRARFGLMATMVLAAALLRLLPHPPNVTPIAAMALFAGAHFDRRAWAFAVPLAAMLLSDAIFELAFGWGFTRSMPIIYACFAATVGVGLLLRARRGVVPVAVAALACSTMFFLVTNLGVWAMSSVYPKTAAGLLACYTAALPFFANTIAGDLVFTAALFGGFAIIAGRYAVFAAPGSLPARA